MKKILKYLEALAFFMIIWIIFNENIYLHTIFVGIFVCLFALITAYRILEIDYVNDFFISPISLLTYFLFLLKEIYKCGWDMVVRILKKDIHPSIIQYDSDLKNELALTFLANSITLTPGTATIYKNDNKLVILSADDDVQAACEGVHKLEKTLEIIEEEM